ncbi:MAG TPA: hypothetical protein VNJ01_16380 [Bacteriovoracaceae bacterium]|nr:hypothetical protein [Bacteriovoracaceae bacterium]
MITRKKSSKDGKSVPQDWVEGVSQLLNETYETVCKKNQKYFDVYGRVYPQEFLVVVSFLSETDPNLLPVTLFLSCDEDQLKTKDKVKETQNNYIELIGLFFDEIFADPEWDQFEPNWQEVSHKHQNYFFKISRENIILTIKADELLGENFEDAELDDEELL